MDIRGKVMWSASALIVLVVCLGMFLNISSSELEISKSDKAFSAFLNREMRGLELEDPVSLEQFSAEIKAANKLVEVVNELKPDPEKIAALNEKLEGDENAPVHSFVLGRTIDGFTTYFGITKTGKKILVADGVMTKIGDYPAESIGERSAVPVKTLPTIFGEELLHNADNIAQKGWKEAFSIEPTAKKQSSAGTVNIFNETVVYDNAALFNAFSADSKLMAGLGSIAQLFEGTMDTANFNEKLKDNNFADEGLQFVLPLPQSNFPAMALAVVQKNAQLFSVVFMLQDDQKTVSPSLVTFAPPVLYEKLDAQYSENMQGSFSEIMTKLASSAKASSTGETIQIGPYAFGTASDAFSKQILASSAEALQEISARVFNTEIGIEKTNLFIDQQRNQANEAFNSITPTIARISEESAMLILNINGQTVPVLLVERVEPKVITKIPLNFNEISASSSKFINDKYQKVWSDTVLANAEQSLVLGDVVAIAGGYYDNPIEKGLLLEQNNLKLVDDTLLNGLESNLQLKDIYQGLLDGVGENALPVCIPLSSSKAIWFESNGAAFLFTSEAAFPANLTKHKSITHLPAIIQRAMIAKLRLEGLAKQAGMLNESMQSQLPETNHSLGIDGLNAEVDGINPDFGTALRQALYELALNGDQQDSQVLDAGPFTLDMPSAVPVVSEEAGKDAWVIPAKLGNDDVYTKATLQGGSGKIELDALEDVATEEQLHELLNKQALLSLNLMTHSQMPIVEIAASEPQYTTPAMMKASGAGMYQVAAKNLNNMDMEQATTLLRQSQVLPLVLEGINSPELDTTNATLIGLREGVLKRASESLAKSEKMEASEIPGFRKELMKILAGAVQEYNRIGSTQISLSATAQQQLKLNEAYANQWHSSVVATDRVLDKTRVLASQEKVCQIFLDKALFPNDQLTFAQEIGELDHVERLLGVQIVLVDNDNRSVIDKADPNASIIFTVEANINALKGDSKLKVFGLNKAFVQGQMIDFLAINMVAKGLVIAASDYQAGIPGNLLSDISLAYKALLGGQASFTADMLEQFYAQSVIIAVLPEPNVVYSAEQ
ncbi:MAG: hypothetical protein ABIB11_03835, partial [Candidatus Omnitrophota bacterium]